MLIFDIRNIYNNENEGYLKIYPNTTYKLNDEAIISILKSESEIRENVLILDYNGKVLNAFDGGSTYRCNNCILDADSCIYFCSADIYKLEKKYPYNYTVIPTKNALFLDATCGPESDCDFSSFFEENNLNISDKSSISYSYFYYKSKRAYFNYAGDEIIFIEYYGGD